jgi:hypothetical protein
VQKTTAHKTLDDLKAAIDTLDFEHALLLCQSLIQLAQHNEITEITEEL